MGLYIGYAEHMGKAIFVLGFICLLALAIIMGELAGLVAR